MTCLTCLSSLPGGIQLYSLLLPRPLTPDSLIFLLVFLGVGVSAWLLAPALVSGALRNTPGQPSPLTGSRFTATLLGPPLAAALAREGLLWLGWGLRGFSRWPEFPSCSPGLIWEQNRGGMIHIFRSKGNKGHGNNV